MSGFLLSLIFSPLFGLIIGLILKESVKVLEERAIRKGTAKNVRIVVN